MSKLKIIKFDLRYSVIKMPQLPISRLQGNGVTAEDIWKLQVIGLTTVESVAFALKEALLAIQGFSEVKVHKIIIEAGKLTSLTFTEPNPYRLAQVLTLTTGSNQLNQLLRGGIRTSYITEIFGEFGTGKTQLCHTLSVTCQLPVVKGGGAGKVLYLDTEATFRPERLVAIAKKYGLNGDQVLENVIHCRAYNSDHQTDLLMKSVPMMQKDRYVLLIVDSATFLYRTEYNTAEELAARQSHLSQFLKTLLRITDEFGIAVVLTNQVYSNMQCTRTSPEDVVPYGGQLMEHAAAKRVKLVKGIGNCRIARIHDPRGLPQVEAWFAIKENGIQDISP